ncbi:MAG: hypothetical protein IKO36_04840 [Bacteroidaceae bacterium]|nr:hypothetical protein [Bacteroidaceae bacterium]
MADKNIALLTKDLCARLPWNVKVLTPNDPDAYTLLALHPNKDIAVIGFEMDGMYVTSKVKIEDCKPLLRPMSDMTEEEKEEYLNIDNRSYSCPMDYAHIPASDRIDWLNEHYLDYHDLAGKDLAKAVTKENNPYRD